MTEQLIDHRGIEEGWLNLAEQILRQHQDRPDAACIGKHDTVDKARYPRDYIITEAAQAAREMITICGGCPVSTSCEDRFIPDEKIRRSMELHQPKPTPPPTPAPSPRVSESGARICQRGHTVEGANARHRATGRRPDCKACNLAVSRLAAVGKKATDPDRDHLGDQLYAALMAGDDTRSIPTPGAKKRGRTAAEKCQRGHPLTGLNRTPSGRCRACRRVNQHLDQTGKVLSETDFQQMADARYEEIALEQLAAEGA